MTRSSCVVVRPLCRVLAALALAICAGCTPRNVGWLSADPTIGPRAAPAPPPPQPHGFLSIATQHLGEPGDELPETYFPVFLYDRAGKWVEALPNNTDTPIALRPGRYIVLVGESFDPMGEFRQVQVSVVDGRTTRVDQSDIDSAPVVWGSSQAP